jgi:hypothetical protein
MLNGQVLWPQQRLRLASQKLVVDLAQNLQNRKQIGFRLAFVFFLHVPTEGSSRLSGLDLHQTWNSTIKKVNQNVCLASTPGGLCS